jgi:cytochrome P450
MPNVAELDLYELPIGTSAFAANPNPDMLAARKKHGWLAKSEFGTVLTDYDAIEDMLRMDETLKPASSMVAEIMGGAGSNWARFQIDILLGADGHKHDHVRAAVTMDFTPKAISAYRTRIQEILTELLDAWAPKGRFELAEFSSRFPISVMFGVLGLPRRRVEEVKDWLEVMGLSFSLDRSVFPEINKAFNNLWTFAEDLVKERRAEGDGGTPGLLDRLIVSHDTGAITYEELIDMIITLFVAGYDTSKNQLGQIMNIMTERPDIWQRCAEDRAYCDDVVDEALRHTGVATTYRLVESATVYRGVTFPVGAMLVFPLSVVGRYSGPFADGMEFKPGRENAKRHQGLGRGMHICLGQHLVRLLVGEGLHAMSKRLKNLRRDGEVTWRSFTGVWGPKELPLAFDAA